MDCVYISIHTYIRYIIVYCFSAQPWHHRNPRSRERLFINGLLTLNIADFEPGRTNLAVVCRPQVFPFILSGSGTRFSAGKSPARLEVSLLAVTRQENGKKMSLLQTDLYMLSSAKCKFVKKYDIKIEFRVGRSDRIKLPAENFSRFLAKFSRD